MWIFGKKSKQDEILKNKAFIENMANSIDVLISLAEADKESVKKLTKVQDEIKYFNPTDKKSVVDIDTKISHKLADIKIALVKAKKLESYTDVVTILDELLTETIVTRKSKEDN